MKWSNDGTDNAEYNVVAIYCDSDTAQSMDEHLYLFTFHNGNPVVLITQQTNGNVTKSADNGPDDGLHFKETVNQDLSNGFKAIANRKTLKLNGQIIIPVKVLIQIVSQMLRRTFRQTCKEHGIHTIKPTIKLHRS